MSRIKLFKKQNEEETPYASIEFYNEEIRRIDGKIKQIDKTIKFYESKKRFLEDWKDEVIVKIKKQGEDDSCKNCEFYKYSENFCLKHNSHVNKEAYCLDFKWKVG